MNMESTKIQKLISEANKACENAYSPYSGYKVGAALLSEKGTIYQGCNVENVSYGATLCAERNAITAAICNGERKFQALAICSSGEDYCYPCGICRQFMIEFSKDLQLIILNGKGEYRLHTLRELLPHAFDSIEVK